MGRYEFVGGGSNKFWHIVYNKTTQEYVAKWGAITAKNFQSKVYTRKEAMKKINEKLNKGYRKVSGYEEEIGNNSTHFIMSDAS